MILDKPYAINALVCRPLLPGSRGALADQRISTMRRFRGWLTRWPQRFVAELVYLDDQDMPLIER